MVFEIAVTQVNILLFHYVSGARDIVFYVLSCPHLSVCVCVCLYVCVCLSVVDSVSAVSVVCIDG